jgi:hypothetical protein
LMWEAVVSRRTAYVAAPGCRTWKFFPPWWEETLSGAEDALFTSRRCICFYINVRLLP